MAQLNVNDALIDAPVAATDERRPMVNEHQTFMFVNLEERSEMESFTSVKLWTKAIEKATQNAKIISHHIFMSPLTFGYPIMGHLSKTLK